MRCPMDASQPPDDTEAPHPAVVWLKRFGVAGFLFFLGKGLLWLTLHAPGDAGRALLTAATGLTPDGSDSLDSS